MTRHEIPAKDPARKVTVYWDETLSAFVGLVRQRENSRAIDYIAVSTISDLKTRLRRYAEFPREMWDTLKADKGAGR
jgi:hypothetical protein